MVMLSRRDALRTIVLAGLGAAGVTSLTGCGDASSSTGASTGLAASDVRRAPGDARLVPEVVEAVQAFTAELFRAAGASGSENLVLSPYSVAIALAMTRNGASGPTAAEMDRVLHAADLETLNGGMNALTRQVEERAGRHKRPDGSMGEVAISVASSLWGQADFTWEQGFLDSLARDYGAGMRLVDYASPERARGLVNAWTEEQTAGRITDLVPAGVLDPLTRLVLVNAIHFKAPWAEPFEGEQRGATFTLEGGEEVEVDMVSETLDGVAYAQGNGWVAARLPYLGGELAMALVVPDDVAAFEGGLDGPALGDLLSGFARQGQVRVVMPRWDFRSRVSLGELLVGMGMPTAFDPAAADLSGMTRDDALFLTHVLHEATVTVDEDGTEAAAATAVVAGVTSAPAGPPVEVVADRPFVFVIHDVATGAPLFIGRVTDPR